jgi:CubicO group peptidase (beta-lactamase class C family)
VLDEDRLDRDLADLVGRARAPGLAVAAVRGEAVIYARGFGVTSVEEGGAPITPATLFPIASTTKPLTGTTILRLVECGALDLDRPVGEAVPWLRFADPAAAPGVTLRRLLSHTAGLPLSASSRYRPYGPGDPGALRRWARRSLPRCRFVAPPGTRYAYSNAGIALAGFVAAAAAGRPFPALLQELVLEPLEMRRTTLDPAVAMTYPVALPHARGPAGALAVVHRFPHDAALAPAAGAISSALELANFAALHLTGGRFRGRQLLTPETVATMHTRHTRTEDPPGGGEDGHGLTFGTDVHKGVRVVEHDGEGGWCTSQLLLAPDRGAGVVVLCNAYRAGLTAAAATLVLDRLLGLPAA